MTRSLLHVTNGESTGSTLRRTALGGAVLPWQDVLHEGPVPAGSRASLRSARARFLAACGWGSPRVIGAELERRDQRLLAALQDGARVVFWFEHDLYDQLQLLDALALVAESGAGVGSLELIVVDSFPGRPSFRGLGELEADELEMLWAARVPATPSLVETAAGAWAAVREPTPVALDETSRLSMEELPFAPAALRRLLAELPGARDGLSGTERRALRAVADGAATPLAAFAAAQEAEEAPFLGDAWFFRALSRLGSGASRLVELDSGEAVPAAPPRGDVREYGGLRLRMTERGARVLEGEEDAVELLGIDRWVGGTHLVPGAVWRWDGAALVAPPA